MEVSLRRSSAKLARRTLSGFESEPIRILLAEDNPRHVQLLRDAMGEAGAAFAGAVPYELGYARSIAETLDHLKAGGTRNWSKTPLAIAKMFLSVPAHSTPTTSSAA